MNKSKYIFSEGMYYTLLFSSGPCIFFLFLCSFINFDFGYWILSIFYPDESSVSLLVFFCFCTFMFMFGVLFTLCYIFISVVLSLHCLAITLYIFCYLFYFVCSFLNSIIYSINDMSFWIPSIIAGYLIKPIVGIIIVVILFRTILYSLNILEKCKIMWFSSSMSHRVLLVLWITIFLFPIIDGLYFFGYFSLFRYFIFYTYLL
jgi:hypothetical protein